MKDVKIRKVKYEGELDLAGYKIPCFVLEDGTRILSSRGMQIALKIVDDAKETRGAELGRFLAQKSLQPFIYKGGKVANFDPLVCQKGEVIIKGYNAIVLPDFCDRMLEARRNIKLKGRQSIVASQCEILMRSFAKVGIIALIDEKTGYQKFREQTLQEILKLYISEEILE